MTAEPPSAEKESAAVNGSEIYQLKIGTWNCQTLNKHIESKKAYCERSQCDFIFLEETKFAYSGGYEPHEFSKNYNIVYFPYRKNRSDGSFGLALMIKKTLKLTETEGSLNDRYRTAKFRFKMNGIPFELVNIYAPVSNNQKKSLGKAREYYTSLGKTYQSLDHKSIIILGGDLNSTIQMAANGSLKPYISENVHTDESKNYHCDVLHNFLVANNLLHLNSKFKIENGNWTWKSSKSGGSESELDGFISNRIDLIQNVEIKERRNFDHSMVISTWNISKKLEARHKVFTEKGHYDEITEIKSTYEERISGCHQYVKVSDYSNLIEFLQAARSEVDIGPLALQFQCLKIEDESEPLGNILEEEVQHEINRLSPYSLPGNDGVDIEMLKKGGKTLVYVMTKLFNHALSSGSVPPEWRTILVDEAKLTEPSQVVNGYAVRPSLVAYVYSNILARKLAPELLDYTKNTRYYLKNDSTEMEKCRQKATENIFILTAVIEKYKDEKFFLAFLKHDQPFLTVNRTSALNSLNEAGVSSQLHSAFTALLGNTEIVGTTNDIEISNETGIYLGEEACRLLLSVLQQGIINKCIRKYIENESQIGLLFGKYFVRRIIFEDQIVFVGESIGHIQIQLEDFAYYSRHRGLLIDGNNIVILRPTYCGDSTFYFQNNFISPHSESYLRYTYYQNRWIDVNRDLEKEIHNRYAHSLRVLHNSMRETQWEAHKIRIFKDKVIPTFFYACEAWIIVDGNMELIEDKFNELLEIAGLKHSGLSIGGYITLEKANFLKGFATNKSSICWNIFINEYMNTYSKWPNDLIRFFTTFEENRGPRPINEVTWKKIIWIVENDENTWEIFMSVWKKLVIETV